MTKSIPPRSIVLYADDDPDDIELISQAFSEYAQNIELHSFPDGLELLRFAECSDTLPTPCLVIIDINMPRLDGKETLKGLRKIYGYSQVPVVLFSTSSLPSDASFARRYNAGFITKPLNSSQINLIIDQFIAHCSDETKKIIRKRDEK